MSFAAFTATAAILFAANNLAAAGCPAALERTVAVMGTTLRIQVCAETPEQALAATEAGFAEVRRLNDVLSSWTPSSEIGRLNGAGAGARVPVSRELFDFLRAADHFVDLTDAAFDPAVGALVDAWQMRGEGRIPTEGELTAALNAAGWHRLQLCADQTVIRGPAGWWLDTGAFGKGAALRGVAGVLKRYGVTAAELDFGGQLFVFGQERVIAVADPRNRSGAVMSLRLRDASISTSSQSERFIEQSGRQYGHILDPRTGKPVAAWGSVSVIANDAMTADALSTALFVMGPRAALEWARNHNDVGVLILENTSTQPRATWNDALSRLIHWSH